ncbi:hypothetical protein OESDEN_05423 [Oesophagostomum dentatum]|uniref:DUF4440 domain-containing protein n=1 Tax=Oesophagostomum dentatum TaxID=61180 RepID=A0A0B1TBM1_OESDE|nr:hypothetical protein OESDEN_05423 [Oesophagostomum dentatum]
MSPSEEAKTVIKPLFDDYTKHMKDHELDKAAEHLDPNFVAVRVGKKAIFGREQLKKEFEESIEEYGKATSSEVTEEEYVMVGDFAVVKGHFEATSEKKGVVKGKFTQIWRKHGDTYLLLHDEVDLA